MDMAGELQHRMMLIFFSLMLHMQHDQQASSQPPRHARAHERH